MNYKSYLEIIEILGYIPENIIVNDMLKDNDAVIIKEDFIDKPYKIIVN